MAIDRLEIEDSIIPRLRSLISSVRDTRYEKVLRSDDWGLTYEQASVLSRALIKDLKGTPANV